MDDAKLDILVAEDDQINALYLRRILTRMGHRVICVEDGLSVLGQVEQQHFDVVLMDIQMPVMNGLEATRSIRAANGPVATLPIVALTAYAMAGDRENFLDAGMDAYITKPADMPAINRAIDVATRARRCKGTA